jgi:hypothetical protein
MRWRLCGTQAAPLRPICWRHAARRGFDYALDPRDTLSAGVQREIWGESVFDFKYALEMRLTRIF